MSRHVCLAAAFTLLCTGEFAVQTHGEEPPKAEGKRVVKSATLRAAAGIVKAVKRTHEQAAGEANADPDDAITKELLQQYRPVLNSELELIRQTCELAPEQRPRIKAAGEASLKKLVARQGRQGQRRVFPGQPGTEEPRAAVRADLRKALEATLTTEQLARYTQELSLRAARQKRAAILMAVSRLDAALYLTAEQRDKISEALSTGWPEASGQPTGQWIFLTSILPDLPDACVVPHLNPVQADAWRDRQKNSFFRSRMMFQNDEESEADGWWDNEPTKAAEAATNKPAS